MEEGKKLIITVLGHDKVGIIAGISNILAETHINILDISQTILQGFFTMIMVVEISQSNLDIDTLRKRLRAKGEELELEITVQHEDIFKFMHRI
ncbi:MAG TPA: ACT domain-containing protein [Syntrophomonadaceae bacterium]|nr:ACT domain-containing protein [Syntrophomonadaceae bacterium]